MILTHTFNVNKVLVKKHQVVHRWAADEMSFSKILFCKYLEYVSLILPDFKKPKTAKIIWFTTSSF